MKDRLSTLYQKKPMRHKVYLYYTMIAVGYLMGGQASIAEAIYLTIVFSFIALGFALVESRIDSWVNKD